MNWQGLIQVSLTSGTFKDDYIAQYETGNMHVNRPLQIKDLI